MRRHSICSRDPSIEPSCRDGSKEGSQHVFVEKYGKLSLNYPECPLIWSSGKDLMTAQEPR